MALLIADEIMSRVVTRKLFFE